MKKHLVLVLAILLAASLLIGCNPGGRGAAASPSAAPTDAQADVSAAPAQRPSALTVIFSNSTDYVFNEIFISPTAANDWGEELLGSTRVLKSNGSIDVEIPAYEYDNYDIQVMDEDRDVYEFTYVPLQNGSEVAISFGDNGLTATVFDEAGTEVAAVSGVLNGGGTGGSGGEDDQPADAGYGMQGTFAFTVYNESDYTIESLYMGTGSGATDEDIDVLEQLLGPGENVEITATVPEELWGEEEWTLFATDEVGDTSSSYGFFNPWTITYVDITWDGDMNGYVFDFNY